jgi:hypothetical protein
LHIAIRINRRRVLHVYCEISKTVHLKLCIVDRNSKIENPRKLAASFALAITAPTPAGQGLIAKKGDESLFAVLRRILPQAILEHT